MNILQTSFLLGRAVDPHSFYYSFETNYRMKSFLELKKTKKVAQKLITIVLVQIYFNYKKNKLKLQGKNFLAFFSFFTQSFPSWIRIRI